MVGLLAVNKPSGPTSHDVIDQVRRMTGLKAGHTGTLDPQASGVLLVMLD
ncbi:MAG: tRNA pseudouridine(55) synthase TruB, partial [Limisphaerales bacterium]